MLPTYYRLSLSYFSALALAFISGCQQPVYNQGTTNQVPTDVRGPASSGQLGPKELQDTTDQMMTSIIDRLGELKKGPDGRTIIVVNYKVTNRSTVSTYDMEIFPAKLRVALANSGSRHDIAFVETPDRAAIVRDNTLEEGLKGDYSIPGARPNYALYVDLYAIEEPAGRYWEMFFKLLDYDPNNPVRNEIKWENSSSYRFAR